MYKNYIVSKQILYLENLIINTVGTNSGTTMHVILMIKKIKWYKCKLALKVISIPLPIQQQYIDIAVTSVYVVYLAVILI